MARKPIGVSISSSGRNLYLVAPTRTLGRADLEPLAEYLKSKPAVGKVRIIEARAGSYIAVTHTGTYYTVGFRFPGAYVKDHLAYLRQVVREYNRKARR